MPVAEAVPCDPVQPSLGGTLVGVLFRPRALFSGLRAGPVAPAARLTALYLALPAVAAVLTDDDLWLGHTGTASARGLMIWGFGTVWSLGPQAFLFRLAMRLFGSNRPLSLAQRGMAAFSALLAVFGVVLSVAGLRPESAPFVITWYASLAAVIVLGFHALFRLAQGAYALPTGKAAGAVLSFMFVHAIALTVALGVLFTIVSP
jgi:hypothetical protein